MKTLKDLRENLAIEKQDQVLDEKNSSTANMPYVLVLKRTGIRIYPNGQKVALYYNEKLNRHVSVPFDDIGVTEEFGAPKGIDRDPRINELSTKTVSGYLTKVQQKKDFIKSKKREKGAILATRKKWMPHEVKVPSRDVKEETNLQEVSKDLLKRYTKKASTDADKVEVSRDHHLSRANYYAMTKDPKAAQNILDKADEKQNKLTNRLRGMSLADRKSNPDKYKNYPKQFKAKVHAKENFDLLPTITEKQKLTFHDGSLMVTEEMAHAILSLHERLTEENRKKLCDMVNGSKEQFSAIAKFALNS